MGHRYWMTGFGLVLCLPLISFEKVGKSQTGWREISPLMCSKFFTSFFQRLLAQQAGSAAGTNLGVHKLT